MNLELEHISSESIWSVEAEKTNRNNLKLSAAVQQQSEKPNVIPYFTSEASLLAGISNPTQGMQAWVGTLYPGTVWNYNGSSWSNTGQVPNVSEQDFSGFAKTGGYDGTLKSLDDSKLSNSELYSFSQLTSAFTVGGIFKANGAIDARSSYKRTSVSNASMFRVQEGAKHYYTGTINHDVYCGVAYFTQSFEFVGYACGGIGVYNREPLVDMPSNAYYIGSCCDGGNPIIEVSSSRLDDLGKRISSRVYVNAVSGSDSNNGTKDLPFATIDKAIDMTGDDSDIFILGDCDIITSINIKRKPTQKKLSIRKESGKRVRIMQGQWIRSASFVDELPNVYSIPMATFSNQWIYQHDIVDDSTLIDPMFRHPLHIGRLYRCGSKNMFSASSIDVVKISPNRYYYDSTNKILYFSVKEGTNLIDNPVVIPSGRTIYGNNSTCSLDINGIEFMYGYADISYSSGVIRNCASRYTSAAGAWVYDMSQGLDFIYCEAARNALGMGVTGDGFNGHSTYPTIDAFTDRTSVRLINCWSHDNRDDGYSDHENCTATIRGGLYEYNKKGGLTPAYGSHIIIEGVTVQNNNQYGIGYVGGVSASEGGYGGQCIAISCIAKNNPINYYCAGDTTSTDINTMTLLSCISILATTSGYRAGLNGKIELMQCVDKGSPIVKDITDNGVFVVNNGVIVE